MTEMEVLKKRLREVKDQLKERTTIVGALTEERDRLLLVEGKLNGTVQQLTSVATTLKREHEVELLRLVKVEEGL